MKAVRVIVSGVVQGVGFRWSVQRAGERAGAGGWVRNLADGRVEVWLEGDAAAVDAVVEFCGRGPEGSRVDDVAVSEEEPSQLDGFRIR